MRLTSHCHWQHSVTCLRNSSLSSSLKNLIQWGHLSSPCALPLILSFHCLQVGKSVQTVRLFFLRLVGLGCCLVGVPLLSVHAYDFGYQCELWNDYLCLWSPRKRKKSAWEKKKRIKVYLQNTFTTLIWNMAYVFTWRFGNRIGDIFEVLLRKSQADL